MATLIYLDEPQLLAMRTGKTHVLALAVPSDSPEVARFVATTVSQSNWESYFDGNTDLRFLFTFPKVKSTFYFDLMTMVDNEVMMDPHSGPIPDADLPLPRLFSSEHTSEFSIGSRSDAEETLEIDGEWDIPEFGDFYQRFTDIYSFAAATRNWHDDDVDNVKKRNIKRTFLEKPFQGGSSYVHFYRGLTGNMTRDERPMLESISYASPGTVKIVGQDDLFNEVRQLVLQYLSNRAAIEKAYQELYGFLQRSRLLSTAGDHFAIDNPFSGVIRKFNNTLCDELGLMERDVIRDLVEKNELVAAKIVLSLSRRILEAATFFAQGRMSYRG